MSGTPWSRPLTDDERRAWNEALQDVAPGASFRGGPSRRCTCGLVRFGPCQRSAQVLAWNRLRVGDRCRGVVGP